ncbi:ABC-type amino acid transporter periplasmic binding protein [Nitratireductor aquibiodomus RA22]|uniref:ABC-type amino acid transporter periplasmic binding protein n=1 Tax=Nitratireductor aquibiodomus RA22 TaxID=1189611 RepID=I5BSV4_9HYPH|nr:transporter substrate-binding domain-containing protein [Nitratireductor aquibiodomus]EIM72656.1 ABC-type amino acid transporter periplasmic binding protein [Nitratireductor aquibiodomus RA22]
MRNLIRNTVIAAATLMAAAFSAANANEASAGEALDRVIAEKKLVVGVAPWNRFVLLNPKSGEYEGFIVDDIRNLEAMTGIKVELVNTTWSGLIAGLQAGKWDVIMSGLGATPERAISVAFSDPIGYLSSTAMVRADSDFKSLADLDREENTITVVSGTAAHQFTTRTFKRAKINPLSDTGAAVLEVMQNRAAAYVGDSVSNALRAKERPTELRDLKFASDETEWTTMNHAVRYSDLDLLTLLNTYVRSMRLRGWYGDLAKKWELPTELATGPQ